MSSSELLRTRRPPRTAPAHEIRTSESVTEGHPDKVADLIADSLLDAHLNSDPDARVALEVLVKDGRVLIGGEVSSVAAVDIDRCVRDAVRRIGYTDENEPFNADGLQIERWMSRQTRELSVAVGSGRDQGAGDQGFMVGYATAETPSLMPLPIVLAHGLTRGLADARRSGAADWLLPDGKAQVSVRYRSGRPVEVVGVVVSTQHRSNMEVPHVDQWVRDVLLPATIGEWLSPRTLVSVNPCGSFHEGGPSADCGVTGRKIIVDTYGGAARHGGGAFSGKDPSKVDRSGAYFCRWAARQIVGAGIATKAEVEVAYAIGQSTPVAVSVNTFGTGLRRAALELLSSFDFSPGGIIQHLDLARPIYAQTTNYGHFGKPGMPWEG
jgi:S-adenosylmethionine synthetase